MPVEKKIKPRERDAIIQSLRSGVTPNIGIQHIQVGRSNEIKSIDNDLSRIADGGSSFRLIIGEYGSGKTFFLNVVKKIAHEKKMVVVSADLSPDRRIHSGSQGGQARSLYSELMKSCSTRSKPDGNAVVSIVEKFISQARKESEGSEEAVSSIIREKMDILSDMVGGYDFAEVINKYWLGHVENDDNLKSNAIKWIRAEYTSKMAAYKDLGVRTIINDQSFYDSLKLMALFVRLSGFTGLLVNLDEMVNLYKLNSYKARESNYEQILRILNDCLQGSVEGIGFFLGGTPQFLTDERKGLYSYDALRSRLQENSFAKKAGITDYSATAMHLNNLAPEEIFILLKNIRHVFSAGDESQYLISDDGIKLFLKHCHSHIGADYFTTPRTTIKGFIDLITTLDQDPKLRLDNLLNGLTIERDRPSDVDDESISQLSGDGGTDSDLVEFKL